MSVKSRVRVVRLTAPGAWNGRGDTNRYDPAHVPELPTILDPYTGEIEGSAPTISSGLPGTKARAVALGSAVFLLLTISFLIVWLLSTRVGGVDTGGAASSGTDSLEVAARLGALAPDFELVNVRTGQAVKLSSLRGKPVFVNFWGTWCPPCRQEMPEMQKVYDKYEGQLAMIGVSMGPRDTLDGVKTFVDGYKYTWTFLQDDSSAVAVAYQAYSIPKSYFIDPTGVIRAVHIGAMDSAMMEGYLQKAR